MRILLTGHDGYIGHVLTPMLLERGHEVTGLDSCLYAGCGFSNGKELPVPVIRKDVRDVVLEDLRGFDAVAHLAGISNDPLGDLAPRQIGPLDFAPHWITRSVVLENLQEVLG